MPEIGTTIEQRRRVLQEDCISFLGAEVTPSLSTPSMIRWMEVACREAVLPQLEPGHDTVGTEVHVSHLAATPLDATVLYRATLVEADGRRLKFEVEAIDERETVGKGTHERFIIDVERFAAGLKKRFAQRPA